MRLSVLFVSSLNETKADAFWEVKEFVNWKSKPFIRKINVSKEFRGAKGVRQLVDGNFEEGVFRMVGKLKFGQYIPVLSDKPKRT